MIRSALALLALTAAVAAAGCGGDHEKKSSTDTNAPQGQQAPAQTSGSTAEDTSPEGLGTSEPEVQKAPTNKEPDAGDEEPIRTPAEFTGKGGKVQPRSINVPPFIAVEVTMRSVDSRSYTLKIAGHTLRAKPRSAASVQLAGIRPGKRYAGTVQGGGSVQVVASGEPGP